MNRKQVFYDRYGVEEYYVYDPDKNDLSGWFRGEDKLEMISTMVGWVSPRLGIRFDCSEEQLQLFRPDGNLFAGYLEISQQLQSALQEVEQERQRAETERQRAETERQRAERLAERLKAMGIDPEAVD
jgi:Uma2 family endonuclease